jgi:hypothetical protein
MSWANPQMKVNIKNIKEQPRLDSITTVMKSGDFIPGTNPNTAISRANRRSRENTVRHKSHSFARVCFICLPRILRHQFSGLLIRVEIIQPIGKISARHDV